MSRVISSERRGEGIMIDFFDEAIEVLWRRNQRAERSGDVARLKQIRKQTEILVKFYGSDE